MAKRNYHKQYDTESLEVKDLFEEPESVSDDVYLMLQLSTIYKVVGKITGKEYVWQGAGTVLPVDRNDAVYLLELSMRRGCCGGGNKTIKPVFVEV